MQKKEQNLSYSNYINNINPNKLNRIDFKPKQLTPELTNLFHENMSDRVELSRVKNNQFWKSYLTGKTIRLDFPRQINGLNNLPVQKEFRFKLDAYATEGLWKLANKEGCLINTMLATLFGGLIARYSGQESVILHEGVRPNTSIEPSEFKSYPFQFPLQIDMSGQKSFCEILLAAEHDRALAISHPTCELYSILKEVCQESGVSFHPEDCIEIIQSSEQNRNERLPLENNPDVKNICLIYEIHENIQFVIKYNGSRYSEEFVEQFCQHFINLTQQLLKNSNAIFDKIDFISEAEKKSLLHDLSALVRVNELANYNSADQKSVHELFEFQVDKTPHHTALTFDDIILTYSELNEKANQLARTLRNRYELKYQSAMPPNTFIGICLGRSLDMVVGLLAILKAGAAYVPLDSEYPQDRLQFMLEDTGAALVLTHNDALSSMTIFKEMDKKKIIVVDDVTTKNEIAKSPADNNLLSISANQLAYVIYTSGSTGKPKGVLVTHGSINNLVVHSNYVHIHPGDCVAQLANTAFDATTFELYSCLLNGAKLALFNKDEIIDMKLLSTKLAQQKVNVMFITTALFNVVVKHDPLILSKMKHVLFGGEKVNTDIVNKYLKETGASNLIHVYGPTETTTFATYYPILASGHKLTSVPIGYPLSGVKLYVLDKNFNICPAGVPGELYIGGLSLAQGYLNRFALTNTTFILNPFVKQAGLTINSRIYKTGDLVTRMPDGSIEYVDRIDSQVKIRGFRIELSEIQNTLLQHSAISQAEVVVVEYNNNSCIAAYYVSTNKKSIDVTNEELKLFLQHKLPSYMMPSFFMSVDKIPLTPNGKVDKKSLPSPIILRIEKECVLPVNETEEFLVSLWRQIFNVQNISTTDNFFKLGGHSLLATWVISRVNARFGLKLSVNSIFKNPKVKDLSQYILSLMNQQLFRKTNVTSYFSIEV